jgi:hypothetical protein
MKFLVISKWKPESNSELRKRMKAWTPAPETKYILEPHRMIGRCKGCFVVEGDDPEQMVQGMAQWEDLVEYEVIPIYPSKKSAKEIT